MKPTTSDQTPEGRAAAPPTAAAGSFGEQLRRAREARGIPLREISEQTRISIRHLEAIEANDFKQLPGGIFNRSFIKSYARYIGFNEAAALDSYTRAAREQGELPDESGPIAPVSRVYINDQSNRSPFVTLLLSAVVLGVLVLGVYAALRGYQRRAAGGEEGAAQVSQTAPPAPAAVNSPGAAVAPTAAAPVVAGLRVAVTAKGEDVWMRVRDDAADSTDVTLRADQTREFTPAERIILQYSKSRAKSLAVTINGRAARVPAESRTPLVEMVINRENYETLLQ